MVRQLRGVSDRNQIQPGFVAVKRRSCLFIANDGFDPGVSDHEFQPLDRILRIKGYVRGSCFQDS